MSHTKPVEADVYLAKAMEIFASYWLTQAEDAS